MINFTALSVGDILTVPPGFSTLRSIRLLLKQTLRMNMFLYYSLSDRDWYIHSGMRCKLNDNRALENGVNIFFGKKEVHYEHQ